jgi:hypothetical protein
MTGTQHVFDAQMTYRNFQVFRVVGSTLRMKAQVDLSSRAQKDFICTEEKRKTSWGHAGEPGKRWILGKRKQT